MHSATPPPEVSRLDLDLLSSLRKIIQALDVQSRHLSRVADITVPQLVCLLEVVAQEGLVARQISARIHVGASTLVGVLDRLEAKGWVRRSRDPEDRRRTLILPTAAGKRLVRRYPSPLGASFDRAFGELSERQRKSMASQLRRLAVLFEPGIKEGSRSS